MFDIAPSELLLVAIVALIVIGPKDLPKAMRVVGHWVGRARGMARHFRSGFDEMVRQAELDEMEKRWAAENARIMAAHPAEPPEEEDDAAQAFGRHDSSDEASADPPATLPSAEPAPSTLSPALPAEELAAAASRGDAAKGPGGTA